MTTSNIPQDSEGFSSWQRKQRNGRIVAGVMVILAGLFYLLYQLDFKIPDWIFSWPAIIIAVSIIAAVKHGLNDWRWILLFLIGALFMGAEIYPDSAILRYKIPIVLFIVGIAIIFKPKNKDYQLQKFKMKHARHHFNDEPMKSETLNEDYIYVNNIFSGVEKVIFSKDFKGGEIKNTFGGCDLNLMQAEIGEQAVIMLNQQFSGTKLIIPPNWVVKSDLTCIFAGVEDKRPIMDISKQASAKTLVLKGNLFMAGLEIVSY